MHRLLHGSDTGAVSDHTLCPNPQWSHEKGYWQFVGKLWFRYGLICDIPFEFPKQRKTPYLMYNIVHAQDQILPTVYLCFPKPLSLNISHKDYGSEGNPPFPLFKMLYKCWINMPLLRLCLCACLGEEWVLDTLYMLCFISTLLATDIDNDVWILLLLSLLD